MGATSSNAIQAKKSQATGGGGKWETYAGNAPGTSLSWSDVSSDAIGECVQAVCAGGDALLLGSVRGGGALSIVICSGEQRYKRYASSAMEAEALLLEIAQIADGRAGR